MRSEQNRDGMEHGGVLGRIGWGSFAAALVALAIGLVFGTARSHGIGGGVNAGLKADRLAGVVLAAVVRDNSDLSSAISQAETTPQYNLASYETGISGDNAVETPPTGSGLPPSPAARATFADRFAFDSRLASFDGRFSVTGVSADRGPDPIEIELPTPKSEPLPVAKPQFLARSEARRPALKLASINPAQLPAALSRSQRVGEESRSPTIDARTAIYDIAARTVYLPNGKKLEAHSGLGEHMDNPRSIRLKSRGPTPPNVYRLTMRESLFHGVRAIRLLPTDNGKMFGRDGILAHSYMLGSNGQSNGCVSFSDYSAFLDAYLKGEVERMVVVERLDKAPETQMASGWFANTFGNLFKSAERTADSDHANDRATAAMGFQ